MVKTLPNIITLLRTLAALAVPLLLLEGGMLLDGGDRLRQAALVLYALAAGTDWLDGLLARRLNATSLFGRMLDPIADKLLLAGCLLALAAAGDFGWAMFVPALLIILREVLVSGLREFVAGHDIVLHVTWLAKFKTTSQLIAVGVAIGAPLAPVEWQAHTAATGLMWLAAILTVASGWGYFRTVFRHDIFTRS